MGSNINCNLLIDKTCLSKKQIPLDINDVFSDMTYSKSPIQKKSMKIMSSNMTFVDKKISK